jgi:1-acyl-sn-glycerol-3-phosphate acyltransferase
VLSSRLRLGSLWISQVARVLADGALRIAAFLELRQVGGRDSDSAWHLTCAVFFAPFIILAPFLGCLSNGLPRRWVLTGSALVALVGVAVFLPHGPWIGALGVVALGSALYSAARYAMLPAAALDTDLPLTSVNGWIEMGGNCAVIGGVMIGLQMSGMTDWGIPLSICLVAGLCLLSVVMAIPCAFPSDVRRVEPALRSVLGFFKDCRRVFVDQEARSSLLALATLQGVVTAGSGAVLTQVLNHEVAGDGNALFSLVFLSVGMVFGCALAAMQGNLRRCLGLIPIGLTGLVLAQVWTALTNDKGVAPPAPSMMLGLVTGLIYVPLRSIYQAAVPADARGNAMAVMNTTIYVMTTIVAVLMVVLIQSGFLADPQAQIWFLAALAALGAAFAWRVLLPQTLELVVEWILVPIHRIHAHGPGANHIPRRGPLLVIANHTTYFDPFWVAKVSPRRVRPMMTSRFYDLPVINWLMKHVVKAIRVPLAPFRREAPELQLAVEELKHGGCMLLFPEGILRRSEDRVLRLFGQGVWHILREVPDTQVVVCWIEGGWGSYCSYRGGSPMTNKKIDFWRRIDIAIEEPQVVPAEILADQRATRRYLMRACLQARRHLGLPVLEDIVPAGSEAMEEADSV